MAAAVTKFDSTSLAEAVKGDMRGLRTLKPEKTTAAVDSNEERRRRCRNLSDVSVRSSRKGRTQQRKKAGLIENDDSDGDSEEAPEILNLLTKSTICFRSVEASNRGVKRP